VTNRTRGLLPAALLAAAALLLSACAGDDPFAARELSISGPENGALYNAEALAELRVEVEAALAADTADDADPAAVLHLDDIRLLLDADDVTEAAERDGDTRLRWSPGELEDGT
jgi:hypothetical protein